MCMNVNCDLLLLCCLLARTFLKKRFFISVGFSWLTKIKQNKLPLYFHQHTLTLIHELINHFILQSRRHMRTENITCTDGNSLHELLSPGICSHHQSQVGLLDQLVHCALDVNIALLFPKSMPSHCFHIEKYT